MLRAFLSQIEMSGKSGQNICSDRRCCLRAYQGVSVEKFAQFRDVVWT